MATASGVTEFLIELYFFPGLKSWGLLNKIGLVMVIVGQLARTLAMFSAKSNFSHHVEYYKEEHHVLVTDGIYRYVCVCVCVCDEDVEAEWVIAKAWI